MMKSTYAQHPQSHLWFLTLIDSNARKTFIGRMLYSDSFRRVAWEAAHLLGPVQELEQFLNRTRRMGCLPGNCPAVSEMVHAADCRGQIIIGC